MRNITSLLRRLALPLLALTVSAPSFAQARFETVRQEMGSLIWHSPRQCVFTLKNTGKKAIYIRTVLPDCGCTLVDWDRSDIPSGGEGRITVRYDAELLGHFEKQVAVFLNTDTVATYLTVSGTVVSELKGSGDNFPYHIGEIWLDSDNLEFDDVHRGDTPTKTIRVYNASRQTLTPSIMHLPAYLTLKAEPETVRPGRTGWLTFTLNSEKLRSYGLTQTNIYMSRYSGDRVSRDNEIYVSATLLPEIVASADGAMPCAQLDSTLLTVRFEAKQKRVKREVYLTNTGAANLEVSAVQVYNPGLGVSLGKRTLEPGEKTKLKITVSNTASTSKGRRRVLLITNDPKQPKLLIDVMIEAGG